VKPFSATIAGKLVIRGDRYGHWRSLLRLLGCTAFPLALTACFNAFEPVSVLPGGINSQNFDGDPSYSSNGRYLAFSSDRRNNRDIFLYDLQRRRLVDLPNLNQSFAAESEPSLSADGRYIAYVSNARGKSDIWVYDRLQRRPQLLTAGVKGSVRHPTITGDGRFIAFETAQLGQWHIAVLEWRR
jgi:Tol biopolymer transport system component